MPSYKAPLDDLRFVLNEVLDIKQLAQFKGFETLDADTVNSMLAMAAQFSEEVLFPLNAPGDREGCVYDRETKSVRTPKGFKEAYAQFCQNGLTAVTCDPDPKYGGLGMPVTLGTAIGEMLCSSNMAFAMYPGLSHGAYNALHEYGAQELRDKYLPKLVTGEWTGTMCLTEPQCGTDLSLIKTKAIKQADGSYAITGTKIFISAGEHDLAENILHLVLARIEAPDTPPGIKGISLFLVPKFIDGKRNPAFCQRIEEKMGIHANSTCEIGLEAATGWLVGEPHKGMKGMFIMMNEARLAVGLQGLGLSEVAYQNALEYAAGRVQSPKIDEKAEGKAVPPSATIIHHPDVRRELLTMRAQAEGGRMLALWVAQQLDISQKSGDSGEKARAKKYLDLLTPIVKAHLTDNAEANASAAMQVFGGHGYIKEHGMEQFLRDARITRIYEGTNGIQALDLIGRKVLLSREGLMGAYLKQVRADIRAARKAGVGRDITCAVSRAACQLGMMTRCLQLRGLFAKMKGDTAPFMRDVGGVASDYLKLASLVAMGHMWVKMAGAAQARIRAGSENKAFYETKLKTARFYMQKIMPQASTHLKAMKSGAGALMALSEAEFAHQQGTVGEKA
jgi:alkylation response protein AidB-like acyl-CoA dehydrogenase